MGLKHESGKPRFGQQPCIEIEITPKGDGNPLAYFYTLASSIEIEITPKGDGNDGCILISELRQEH